VQAGDVKDRVAGEDARRRQRHTWRESLPDQVLLGLHEADHVAM
jgi:hypothetical protein